MATTVEELEESITQAVAGRFRNQLMDRGEARSMIWRDGQLPDGSPPFARTLSYDLFSYSLRTIGDGAATSRKRRKSGCRPASL